MRQRPYRYTSYSKTVFDMQADTVNQAVGDTLSAAEPDTTAAAQADTAEADTAAEKFLRMLGRQHLFLIESATKKSFIPPAAEKEEVLAMRVSGLKDPSFLALVAQTKTFSIYAPQIDISDKELPRPHRSGQHRQVPLRAGGHPVPRPRQRVRDQLPAARGTKFDGLKGLLYINTNGYAVQNVTAEPMKTGPA
jgi:hypothetical protein